MQRDLHFGRIRMVAQSQRILGYGLHPCEHVEALSNLLHPVQMKEEKEEGRRKKVK